MEAATLQATPFTPFQIEMLELIAKVNTEREMSDIRRLLASILPNRQRMPLTVFGTRAFSMMT